MLMSDTTGNNNIDNPHDNIPEAQFNEVRPVSRLYEDWFLDYASYVILERAVPRHADGLKRYSRLLVQSDAIWG